MELTTSIGYGAVEDVPLRADNTTPLRFGFVVHIPHQEVDRTVALSLPSRLPIVL